MADLHQMLIEQMCTLGYFGGKKPEGICKGFTMMAVQAAVIGQLDVFIDRVDFIINTPLLITKHLRYCPEIISSYNPLLELINAAKKSIKQHGFLSQEQKLGLEILSFFDGMSLYYEPKCHNFLFSKPLSQHHEEEISKFISSQTIEQQGGLAKIFSTSNVYYLNSLTTYLKKLESIVCNKQLIIELLACNHSIVAIFNSNTKRGWQLFDVNNLKLLRHIFSCSKHFAEQILQSFLFANQKYYAITTNIYTTKQYSCKHNIQPMFFELQHISEHKITLEKLIFSNGNSWLFEAAATGQLILAQKLIIAKAEVDCVGKHNATPLFMASHNGHTEIVQLLITCGADVNKPMDEGITPLFMASENGYKLIVQILLQAGADVNKCNIEGATPLFMASQQGHAGIVQLLLEAGANLHKPCVDGATSLCVATQNGHVSVVSILLYALKDLFAKVTETISKDYIIQDITKSKNIAILKNNTDIVMLLTAALDRLAKPIETVVLPKTQPSTMLLTRHIDVKPIPVATTIKQQTETFSSPSKYATKQQPYGPYADHYCFPPELPTGAQKTKKISKQTKLHGTEQKAISAAMSSQSQVIVESQVSESMPSKTDLQSQIIIDTICEPVVNSTSETKKEIMIVLVPQALSLSKQDGLDSSTVTAKAASKPSVSPGISVAPAVAPVQILMSKVMPVATPKDQQAIKARTTLIPTVTPVYDKERAKKSAATTTKPMSPTVVTKTLPSRQHYALRQQPNTKQSTLKPQEVVLKSGVRKTTSTTITTPSATRVIIKPTILVNSSRPNSTKAKQPIILR